MRRSLIIAVLALVVFAMPAVPAFAQAPAAPPAPKVTITGTFDQITSAGKNVYDGNFARDNDREWYARTRFRPDFEFAVGRTRAVLGVELDLNYGQTGSNDGGFPGNGTGQACGFAGGCKGGGAGACANAGNTGIARTTNASTAVTRLLLITASSSVVSSRQLVAETRRRHHQPLPLQRHRWRLEILRRAPLCAFGPPRGEVL